MWAASVVWLSARLRTPEAGERRGEAERLSQAAGKGQERTRQWNSGGRKCLKEGTMPSWMPSWKPTFPSDFETRNVATSVPGTAIVGGPATPVPHLLCLLHPVWQHLPHLLSLRCGHTSECILGEGKADRAECPQLKRHATKYLIGDSASDLGHETMEQNLVAGGFSRNTPLDLLSLVGF